MLRQRQHWCVCSSERLPPCVVSFCGGYDTHIHYWFWNPVWSLCEELLGLSSDCLSLKRILTLWLEIASLAIAPMSDCLSCGNSSGRDALSLQLLGQGTLTTSRSKVLLCSLAKGVAQANQQLVVSRLWISIPAVALDTPQSNHHLCKGHFWCIERQFLDEPLRSNMCDCKQV